MRKITKSMEDYLEAIYILMNRNGAARVSDISWYLSVKKPSVSGALSVLSERGLVDHERYGCVALTRRGRQLAENVIRRHEVLVKFLMDILKLDAKTASLDACNMEHAMSHKTFERLSLFIKSLEKGRTAVDSNGK